MLSGWVGHYAFSLLSITVTQTNHGHLRAHVYGIELIGLSSGYAMLHCGAA